VLLPASDGVPSKKKKEPKRLPVRFRVMAETEDSKARPKRAAECCKALALTLGGAVQNCLTALSEPARSTKRLDMRAGIKTAGEQTHGMSTTAGKVGKKEVQLLATGRRPDLSKKTMDEGGAQPPGLEEEIQGKAARSRLTAHMQTETPTRRVMQMQTKIPWRWHWQRVPEDTLGFTKNRQT